MTAAILFDRDGTLIVDRPPNRDPEALELMPFVREALALARSSGLRIGVVTNQPGLGRGDVSEDELQRVHKRIEELTGGIDGWFICPHEGAAVCACRKPMPGLIAAASTAFGIDPTACVVIGDIGSDVDAAAAIGARAVLVPTPVTRAEEVESAPVVAHDVLDAVRRIVRGRV